MEKHRSEWKEENDKDPPVSDDIVASIDASKAQGKYFLFFTRFQRNTAKEEIRGAVVL